MERKRGRATRDKELAVTRRVKEYMVLNVMIGKGVVDKKQH